MPLISRRDFNVFIARYTPRRMPPILKLDCCMFFPNSGACQEKVRIRATLYTISQTPGFMLFKKALYISCLTQNKNPLRVTNTITYSVLISLNEAVVI